jgi:hypothetical protein
MKTNLILLISILFFISCDENQLREFESELNPVSISFVYEDGTPIPLEECLSDENEYAIEIETVNINESEPLITKVDFTFNGTLYSLTFSEPGKLRVPVNLRDGSNVCQIVETQFSSEVIFTRQDDFSLVE